MPVPFLSAFVQVLDTDVKTDACGKSRPHAKVIAVAHQRVGQVVSSEWGYWHAVTLDGREIHGDFGYDGWRRALWALLSDVESRGALPATPAVPRTRAEWLRYLCSFQQHGQSTSATSAYLGHDMSGRLRDGMFPWPVLKAGEGYSKPTEQIMQELRATATKMKVLTAFQARLRRFVHHVTEVSPGWKLVREVDYADNSTEVEEIARNGTLRRRMTTGPGGDACF